MTPASELAQIEGGEAAQTVLDALTSRYSVRAFLDRPVGWPQIERLLDAARHAPSGSNTQPWKVCAVAGKSKDLLCQAILADFWSRPEGNESEYQYYPTDWYEPYLERRRSCGWGLYGSLGIERGETDKMRSQMARNYDFFGAPVGLIFSIDRRLNLGSWLDLGMFIQSIMLVARAEGLHSCPQAAFMNYHQIIRGHLQIPEDEIVVCGMAIGYRDKDAPENHWRTEREPTSVFARAFGF